MLEQLLESARNKINSIKDSGSLQKIRSEYLGKSSLINQEMQKISRLVPVERKIFGQKINKLKKTLQAIFDKQELIIQDIKLKNRFKTEEVDLTIPARPRLNGSIHPITQCLEELIQVFSKYGFNIKDGPDIETEWYNFTALNMDNNHPARQMHDTFYLKNQVDDITRLLRTHTSTIQIHTMENEKPPYRFIAPGRAYRSDSDLTHTPMFHQIEGVLVDKNIHMGHLKHVITDSIRTFFEQSDIMIQFRPSFFPFTEPSAEVDIKKKESSDWLEVLGCGMLHPDVLMRVGVNPDIYQGFAFGLGIERFAMLKYGIRDLRQFFEGDTRWLNKYNFSALNIPTLTGSLS